MWGQTETAAAGRGGPECVWHAGEMLLQVRVCKQQAGSVDTAGSLKGC